MRIVIESTEEIVVIDGVPNRAWTGVTDGGVRVIVMVNRIITPADRAGDFEREAAELMAMESPLTFEKFAPIVPYEEVGPFPEWN